MKDQDAFDDGLDLGRAILDDAVRGDQLTSAYADRPLHATASAALAANGVWNLDAVAEGVLAAVEEVRFEPTDRSAQELDDATRLAHARRACGG